MVVDFMGVHEHMAAWGGVHWQAIGHADPGTGYIDSLVNNSINFFSVRG